MPKKKCPICHQGLMKRGTKTMTYQFKGHSIKIDQSGLWCNLCKEGILSSDDLETNQSVLKEFRKSVRKEQAQSLKEIRRKLGLSQKRAGEIFGGGINAFSRYERGETEAPLATKKLLHLLDKHPDLLKELM